MHHQRLHRRLLRPGDLDAEHLRPVRLDPLSLERDRRRWWTGLLPAAGTRNHPPDSLRTDILMPAPGRAEGCPIGPGRSTRAGRPPGVSPGCPSSPVGSPFRFALAVHTALSGISSATEW